jgi:5'-3' exonuclease
VFVFKAAEAPPPWKIDYYAKKLGVTYGEGGAVDDIARAYLTGICWCQRYYYKGCPSWGWFYPYHYAPFLSGPPTPPPLL